MSLLRLASHKVHDLSIPIRFDGTEPNAFGLPVARHHAVEAGEFVGDTRRGGSCNCETIEINPHGNGTHTECVGHLTQDRLSIHHILKRPLMSALVITVSLKQAGNDNVVTSEEVERGISKSEKRSGVAGFDALVIRTLPNDPEKKSRQWSGGNPPYVGAGAMRSILERGVQHLLVDLPSLDREDDPLLVAHRIFWELPAEGAVESAPGMSRTITEMIYVPEDVHDGRYLLNLQIPPIALDAAPSRPILIEE